MCNAKKHSPGCTCGFGPPYPPRYRIGSVTEWADTAAEEPTLVRRSLRQTGWDERSIQDFAVRLAALDREPLPRRTRVEQIRELLRMRRQVVEETWTEVVDVPLYRFGAPPVRGAKVEYSEGEHLTDGSGWSLKFLGVGVANTASVEVSRGRTVTATDGTWKQVFVPVLVRVSRVAVYDGDRLVGRGHKAEAVPPSEAGDPLLQKRGVRVVAGVAGAAGRGQLAYHDMIDLALAGDTTGAVVTEKRSWVTDIGWELSLPLSKVVKAEALVRVKRVRRLELVFALPGGHDYRAYLCQGYTHWESPRGVLPKPARRPASGETAA